MTPLGTPTQPPHCPECGGAGTALLPEPAAHERRSNGRPRWLFGATLGLLFALWWPVGLAAAVGMLMREARRMTLANFYRCSICAHEFSLDPAEHAPADRTIPLLETAEARASSIRSTLP